MNKFPIDFCKFSSCAALNLSLESCFSFVSLCFSPWVTALLFIMMCASFITENQGKRKPMARISQIRKLQIAILQVSRTELFQDCYSNSYSNSIVPYLFQFFCSHVLSLFLQAYYFRIPSMNSKLLETYNYAHNLSTNYFKLSKTY